MSLFERLQVDRKSALKAKQKHRKDILGYVLAQLKNKKIDLQRELTDEEVIKIIQKEVKMREESISFLKSSGQTSDVAIEKEKIACLEAYLPKLLTREELSVLVAEKIFSGEVKDVQREKGKLIGAIMKEQGPAVDGRLLQDVIHSYSKE